MNEVILKSEFFTITWTKGKGSYIHDFQRATLLADESGIKVSGESVFTYIVIGSHKD